MKEARMVKDHPGFQSGSTITRRYHWATAELRKLHCLENIQTLLGRQLTFNYLNGKYFPL